MSQLDQKAVEENLEAGMGGDGDIAESLSELLDSLTDEEQDMLLSDLSEKEIRHISVLESTGDELTQEFLQDFRRLKVSSGRKGRKELIDVAGAISSVFEAQQGGRMDMIKDKMGL